MGETLSQKEEALDKLELESLKVGEVVEITTGKDEEAWQYTFTVEDTVSQWPQGKLVAATPTGEITQPVGFHLHGSGSWTDRSQNPVQTQDRGFSSYFDRLYRGEYMVGKFEGETIRSIFDKKGQEITKITRRS